MPENDLREEESLSEQYESALNVNARIRLHTGISAPTDAAGTVGPSNS